MALVPNKMTFTSLLATQHLQEHFWIWEIWVDYQTIEKKGNDMVRKIATPLSVNDLFYFTLGIEFKRIYRVIRKTNYTLH